MGDVDVDERRVVGEGEGNDADADAPDEVAAPAQLSPPENGEVYCFTDHSALLTRFNSILNRGALLNRDPTAGRPIMHDRTSNGPVPPLVAYGRAVMNIETSPPHFIYLIEQGSTWEAVLIGIGMVRRTYQSSPTPVSDEHQRNLIDGTLRQVELRRAVQERRTPRRVQGVSQRPRASHGNAVGLGLDFLNSIGIAMTERMHTAVVIYRPPGTLGGSWDQERGQPYHFVLTRPLQGDFRLGNWQLMSAQRAAAYLE